MLKVFTFTVLCVLLASFINCQQDSAESSGETLPVTQEVNNSTLELLRNKRNAEYHNYQSHHYPASSHHNYHHNNYHHGSHHYPQHHYPSHHHHQYHHQHHHYPQHHHGYHHKPHYPTHHYPQYASHSNYKTYYSWYHLIYKSEFTVASCSKYSSCPSQCPGECGHWGGYHACKCSGGCPKAGNVCNYENIYRGHYLHPFYYDASKYIQCDSTPGVLYIRSCPYGLVFDARFSVCNYPSQVYHHNYNHHYPSYHHNHHYPQHHY